MEISTMKYWGLIFFFRRGEESVNTRIVTEVNVDLFKKFLRQAFTI